MVRRESGRWDVSIKDNAVYLERVSDSDEQLFEDSLASDEARRLAQLLTKFADKLDGSEDSEVSGDSEDADEPKDPEDAKDSDKSSD